MTQEPRVLAYLAAFDPKGLQYSHQMAKLLVASLLRSHFTGEILVFRNRPKPLFQVPRVGVQEVYISTPPWDGEKGGDECLAEVLSWRFRARDLINTDQHDVITYLDNDCLALRNIDHLFVGDWDLLYQPERGRPIKDEVFNGYLEDEELKNLQGNGINAGTFAVRSEHYHAVTEYWEEIFERDPTQHDRFRDQTAWNRLLLDTSLKKVAFERSEIAFPFHLDPDYREYRKAALLHMVGGTASEKLAFAMGQFMSTYFHDEYGVYLDLIEP